MKKKLFLFLIITVSFSAYYYLNRDSKAIISHTKNETLPKKKKLPINKAKDIKASKTLAKTNKIPKSRNESIKAYYNMAIEKFNKNIDPQDFYQEIDQLQLSPIASKDQNEYTGSVITVRTNENFPGTRYFHAQLFGDESGASLNHLSYEVQVSSQEFETFADNLQKELSLKKPIISKTGFKQWELDKNHIIYIKVLTVDDTEDHPHNVYKADDVGTITKVVIEQNLHSHEH